MEFYDVIESRKSVRDFLPKPIPENILDKMTEAARLSPSFQNRQCWRFIFVRNEELKHKLALESGLVSKVNYFIKNAPLVVVACADVKHSGTMNKQDYYLVDTTIAFQQMMLTAWNFGLGSCWLAAFNEKKVKEILNIPEQIRVVALSPFGFPKDKKTLYSKALATFAGSKKRIPTENMRCEDSWTF